LSLILINVLIILSIFTNTAINTVKEKVDISIYLKPNIVEDQAYAFKAKIESLPQTKEVEYVSPDLALKRFKERHQKNDTLIESLNELEENPLGITLVVRAKAIDDYPLILEKIEGKNFSEYSNWIADKDFNNYKIIIEKLNSTAKKINTVGLAASAIFLFITVLIIFNTIRVAIYTHKEEIEIMRLVGATSKFINGPFLVESVLYGLLSWAIVIIIMFPILNLFEPYLREFIGTSTGNFSITEYFNANFIKIFGLQLLLIVMLSIISSGIAVRKYLKV